jgi:hypothetical protein
VIAQIPRVGNAALAEPAFLFHDLSSYIPGNSEGISCPLG